MPRCVIWYERLSYLGVGLSALMLPLTGWNTGHYLKKSPVLYPLLLIAIFAIQLIWIWMIARRRQNWARWTSALILIIGVPGLILDFEQRYRLDHTATIAYYSIYLLFGVAVALLFLPSSRDWFQRNNSDPC